MRRIDINARYRSVAIFCAIHGGKNEGRNLIPWDVLKEKYGEAWETYTHELMVNGMLHGANDYMYLTPEWASLTPTERMERIKQMYPYPYQQR